jgi:hypothetical protein
MLAVDLVGFFSLVALWPILGRWSFPVALFLSTVVSAGVVAYYVTRAWRLMGFQPLDHLNERRRRLSPETRRELVAAGMGSGVMSLDAMLALLVLLAGAQRENTGTLLALLFAISPMIRGGFEWAQLFYFDLKRLESAAFGNLGHWLTSRVCRLGWVIGPIFWAAACVAAGVVNGRLSWPLGVALLPFFLSRALLAAIQVRSFAVGDYTRLITNGLLVMAGYLGVSLFFHGTATVVGLATVNGCATLFLWRQQSGGLRSGPRAEAFPAPRWLELLRQCETPVQITALRYRFDQVPESRQQHKDAAQRKLRSLAREIARQLGRNGAVTVMHPHRILWFDRRENEKAKLLRWAITRAGGLLETLGQARAQNNGLSALRDARGQGFLGDDVRSPSRADFPSTAQQARIAFLQMFPEGTVWSPDGSGKELAASSPKELRELLADASSFAQSFYPNRSRSGLDVTALCCGSNLELVFIPSRQSDPALRLRWRTLIRRINLDAAMQNAGAPASTLPSGRHGNTRSRSEDKADERPSLLPAGAA